MLSKEEVEKIAELSRLEFKEDEIEKFQNQLNNIINYFEKLSEVDTEGIEPLSHAIDLKNSFRENISEKSLDNKVAHKNSPQSIDNSFVVPKVVG